MKVTAIGIHRTTTRRRASAGKLHYGFRRVAAAAAAAAAYQPQTAADSANFTPCTGLFDKRRYTELRYVLR